MAKGHHAPVMAASSHLIWRQVLAKSRLSARPLGQEHGKPSTPCPNAPRHNFREFVGSAAETPHCGRDPALRLPGKKEAVGVVHRPEIQRPNRSPESRSEEHTSELQ